MATPRLPGSLSRRGLLKLAGAAAAALGAVAERVRVAADEHRGGGFERPPRRGEVLAYYLDPEWGAGEAGCPATPAETHRSASHACHACTACHRHAAYKLWATEAAVRRAHPHCRCEVRSRPLAVADYRRRFGVPLTPTFRAEFDDRWA